MGGFKSCVLYSGQMQLLAELRELKREHHELTKQLKESEERARKLEREAKESKAQLREAEESLRKLKRLKWGLQQHQEEEQRRLKMINGVADVVLAAAIGAAVALSLRIFLGVRME